MELYFYSYHLISLILDQVVFYSDVSAKSIPDSLETGVLVKHDFYVINMVSECFSGTARINLRPLASYYNLILLFVVIVIAKFLSLSHVTTLFLTMLTLLYSLIFGS